MSKVRRIDFHPDNYIGGIFGRLNVVQVGVYWTVCAYIYSDGGPLIENADLYDMLARCLKMRRPHVIATIQQLVDKDKLQRTVREGVTKLSQRVAERELNAASRRIETNTKNARGNGKSKQNQEHDAATAISVAEPPAIINNQPPITNNQIKKKTAMPDGMQSDFDQWWLAYPCKKAKDDAIRAYVKARQKTDHQTLLDGIAAYKRGKPEYQDWAHAATWLNGGRWKDDYSKSSIGESSSTPWLNL